MVESSLSQEGCRLLPLGVCGASAPSQLEESMNSVEYTRLLAEIRRMAGSRKRKKRINRSDYNGGIQLP
jgi:hypothetical protein